MEAVFGSACKVRTFVKIWNLFFSRQISRNEDLPLGEYPEVGQQKCKNETRSASVYAFKLEENRLVRQRKSDY